MKKREYFRTKHSLFASQKDFKSIVQKLRFGIVGCGVICSIHSEAIASLLDAQLVLVVDINPKRAHKLADVKNN